MHKLHELKETLCAELEEYAKKGKIDVGSLDVVDKLTHTIKNLDKIIEKYEDEEYSGNYGSYASGRAGGAYMGGGRYSRDMYSGARGRGTYAKRDAMGRYSSDSGMMIAELRELMAEAPNQRTRDEFDKFIRKMETME